MIELRPGYVLKSATLPGIKRLRLLSDLDRKTTWARGYGVSLDWFAGNLHDTNGRLWYMHPILGQPVDVVVTVTGHGWKHSNKQRTNVRIRVRIEEKTSYGWERVSRGWLMGELK